MQTPERTIPAVLQRVAESLALKRFTHLRYRLLALVLVPLLLLSGSVILLASKWSSDYTYEQLFTKVNTDLRVAGKSFRRIQEDGSRELSSLASSALLANALEQGDGQKLVDIIDEWQLQHGFDFLRLYSANGQQILQLAHWQAHKLRASPLTDEVMLKSGEKSVKGFAGIEIYEVADWKQVAGIEAETVLLPLVATVRAAPTSRVVENRAMIIRTLQPVVDVQGRRIALLEGGVLLNRNFEFVDEIRDLVYGPGSLAPGSRGTVTVFLEDVRITTNVPTRNEPRALGTRVSAEVRDAVLNQGATWVDRAFVVTDWYISAYEPIIDVAGNRVGMLYAGYLEAPFRAELFKAIAILSALVLAGGVFAVGAAFFGAKAIFTPIETMSSVVRATAAGEHRRIGPVSIGSEIGELASQFDVMLDTLEFHRERIERDAAMLEDKVQHRTAELEKQNQRLQDSIDLLHQTRRQLANAEKLAALGELTAGVAHEINNPTAVILGNMDVLVADLGDSGSQYQTEIDLIFEQVYRIRSITDQLLQYSRSELYTRGRNNDADEFLSEPRDDVSPGLFEQVHYKVEPVQLAIMVDESLRLLVHELEGSDIQVGQKHWATMLADIDRQEIQQVLVNLISNALEAVRTKHACAGELEIQFVAMKHDRIEIETYDDSDTMVALVVRDTGCGIDPQHVVRVFDPFFTSGKVQGTGLGLSVSYGIVRRYGGDIHVRSELGHGSEFTVLLPCTSEAGTDTVIGDQIQRLVD